LSDELKSAFPDILPVPRPLVLDQVIKNPHWLAGFTSGEGCFRISMFKSKTKLGEAVQLEFSIGQHSRDELLLKTLVSYLGCGWYVSYKDFVKFKVTKLGDLTDKVIPLFPPRRACGGKSIQLLELKL